MEHIQSTGALVKATHNYESREAEEIEVSEQPTAGTEGSLEKAENPKKQRRPTSNEKESSNKRIGLGHVFCLSEIC